MKRSKHTQSQQDKIQEIMGLVDAAIMGAEGHEATDVVRDIIQSKLRELVREPLTQEQIERESLHEQFFDGVRFAERAHGITNTSGES